MDKNQQRIKAREQRAALTPEYRAKASLTVSAKIAAMEALSAANIVMCYMPLGTELNLRPLCRVLDRQGKTLCFPVSGQQGIMEAYAPLDENSWCSGKFGITEPEPESSKLINPSDIDVVICPALAFDENKMRLGYGKGYYDRFLPRCKKALRILAAFEEQRMERIITDQYDQQMDIIVTEIAEYK